MSSYVFPNYTTSRHVCDLFQEKLALNSWSVQKNLRWTNCIISFVHKYKVVPCVEAPINSRTFWWPFRLRFRCFRMVNSAINEQKSPSSALSESKSFKTSLELDPIATQTSHLCIFFYIFCYHFYHFPPKIDLYSSDRLCSKPSWRINLTAHDLCFISIFPDGSWWYLRLNASVRTHKIMTFSWVFITMWRNCIFPTDTLE